MYNFFKHFFAMYSVKFEETVISKFEHLEPAVQFALDVHRVVNVPHCITIVHSTVVVTGIPDEVVLTLSVSESDFQKSK